MMYLKIKKSTFYLINFLILLLPVSNQYKLLLFGVRTTGVAVDYEISAGSFDVTGGSAEYRSTIFEYTAGDHKYRITGPQNRIYKLGETKKIIYNKNKPGKSMMPSIAYLYSFKRIIIPVILFIVWLAFYSSFVRAERFNN